MFAKLKSLSKPLLLITFLGGVCVIWLLSLHALAPNSWSASEHSAYEPKSPPRQTFLRRYLPCTLSNPCHFRVVADLDQKSRDESNPGVYKSYLLEGKYYTVKRKAQLEHKIQWGLPHLITSKHSEANRGMELSELILTPEGSLLSGDDRTGIVYEHLKHAGEEIVVPRYLITEGNGESNKGAKLEWATIFKGEVWWGSFGKDYTGGGGEILSRANFWVASISRDGNIKRYDWTPVYNKIRSAVGVDFPGYIIHEAVNWSNVLKRWVFLPRRVSDAAYNEMEDEKKGANLIISCDENFENFHISQIGRKVPERGFSSFKFLPGSNDEVILALKSVESSETNTQCTYISAFGIDGKIFVEDELVPGDYKYEGLEFFSF